MITLLKKSSYLESPWKNGKGITRQIAIFPQDATVSEGNYLWRISSAQVAQAAPFSLFPDCDRQLIVWRGAGLLLNGTPLPPDSPLFFSGEEEIDCKLINDEIPVDDLGIIYKRNSIKAKLKVLVLKTPVTLKLDPGTHFLFLAHGDECLINDIKLQNGDSLKVFNQNELSISSEGSLTMYHINIF